MNIESQTVELLEENKNICNLAQTDYFGHRKHKHVKVTTERKYLWILCLIKDLPNKRQILQRTETPIKGESTKCKNGQIWTGGLERRQMSNKLIKRCSAWLVFREMPIKILI